MVQTRPFSRGNERGQALIEYAAIVALVGACLVAILGLVGRATNRAYERTASAVSGGKSGYQGGSGVILTGTSSAGRRGGRGEAEPPPDSTAGDESEEEAGAPTAASR